MPTSGAHYTCVVGALVCCSHSPLQQKPGKPDLCCSLPPSPPSSPYLHHPQLTAAASHRHGSHRHTQDLSRACSTGLRLQLATERFLELMPRAGWHSSYWGHGMPVLGTPRLKIQVIDLGRSKERDQARANAMGTRLSIALEACVTDIRHPASCPLAAGQPRRARWLAGRMHEFSLSSEFWIMHA